jgi:hypothetical protein
MNYKGFDSINVHCVVDARGRFIDVLTGYPGRAHDTWVLENSEFGSQLLDAESPLSRMFHANARQVGGVDVPFLVIADSAYPCRTLILPAFKECEATSDERRTFNHKHASTRNIVERSFGQMKNRWRVLLQGLSVNAEHINDAIMACCVLHNICIDKRDKYGEEDPQQLRQRDAELNALWVNYERRLAAAAVPVVAPVVLRRGADAELEAGRRIREAMVNLVR